MSCKKYVLRARSQGLAGQLAVSLVVLNRVKDDRFPNTICEVVHQNLLESLGKLKVKMFQKVKEHITQYEIVANLVGTVMVKVMNQKNQQLMVHCMTWHLI